MFIRATPCDEKLGLSITPESHIFIQPLSITFLSLPLDNVIEQDHRFVKRRVRSALGYRTFDTAERALSGIEAMHMVGKGQIKRVGKDAARGQAEFIAELFAVAA